MTPFVIVKFALGPELFGPTPGIPHPLTMGNRLIVKVPLAERFSSYSNTFLLRKFLSRLALISVSKVSLPSNQKKSLLLKEPDLRYIDTSFVTVLLIEFTNCLFEGSYPNSISGILNAMWDV